MHAACCVQTCEVPSSLWTRSLFHFHIGTVFDSAESLSLRYHWRLFASYSAYDYRPGHAHCGVR